MWPFWIVGILIRDLLSLSHKLFIAFHDDLDFVSVQEKLAQEFKAVAPLTRGKHSLEVHIENIARVKASALTEKSSAPKTALLHVR